MWRYNKTNREKILHRIQYKHDTLLSCANAHDTLVRNRRKKPIRYQKTGIGFWRVFLHTDWYWIFWHQCLLTNRTIVTPPTAKRWLSVVRCVRQQSVYFVKYFITNNTKSSQRNDNTVAKHTQNIQILKALGLLQSKLRTHKQSLLLCWISVWKHCVVWCSRV